MLRLRTEPGYQLLECWICNKLGQHFVAQTVHRGILTDEDDKTGKVKSAATFPLCCEHQRWSADEINAVLTQTPNRKE